MNFVPKKNSKIGRYQEGGSIEEEAPVTGEEMPVEEPQEQQNPLIVLAQAAMQGLQTQDCQLMGQVCQGLIQLVQQMQGPAPLEETGEPVFKKGGVLLRRVKK